jgi:hypothetical protein
MTPNVAMVQISSPHWRGIRLWLPLFLLWIPLILLSPLLLLILAVVSLAGRVNPFRAVAVLWSIVCGLRGSDVHVDSQGSRVLVRIF